MGSGQIPILFQRFSDSRLYGAYTEGGNAYAEEGKRTSVLFSEEEENHGRKRQPWAKNLSVTQCHTHSAQTGQHKGETPRP